MTTYKVTAETGYAGYEQGAEFEADLDPFLEQWALDNGAIEPVKKTTKKKEDGGDG